MTGRVVWREGMFLRAQHFQQQDRWTEHLLRGVLRGFGPYHWGFCELALDEGRLGIGEVVIARAAGVFPDGTVFAFPDPSEDATTPPALKLPDGARNLVVHLTLAAPPLHAVQIAASGTRLAAEELQAADTYPPESGDAQPGPLEVARLRLRLAHGDQALTGYTSIAAVSIEKVTPDGRAHLDRGFIPPVLFCHAAPPLHAFLPELSGMINQIGGELAGRLGERDIGPRVGDPDFQVLQVANRWLPLIRHWAGTGCVHPEQLYAALVQIAGEWATFSNATHRPYDLPPYRHDDLRTCFEPLIEALRRSIATPIGPGVMQVPLEELGTGAWRALLRDRGILDGALFLAVCADMTKADLQRLFPRQVKIGPIETMRDLVASAVSGIAVNQVPAPRQLPFVPGAVYFELDRKSTYFAPLQRSPGIGFHVSSDFPGLSLQLWSVRG